MNVFKLFNNYSINVSLLTIEMVQKWPCTGFPVGGGRQPSRRGASTDNFAKFSEKLHEIEKILGRMGARRGRPLGSAIAVTQMSLEPKLRCLLRSSD